MSLNTTQELLAEVRKASTISPDAGSLTMIAGPPGTGKSTFAGTVAEFLSPEEVLVIATLPREIDSMKYQEYDLDTLVIDEPEWRPTEGTLRALGYSRLMQLLKELRKDERYGAVILDNGTEAAEMAWHAAMEPLGVGDPNQMKGGNRFAPYVSLREKMEQMIADLALLTGKTGFGARPKHIIIPWHIQPPKDSMDDDESADDKGRGSEYEGEFLPMIRGSFRRRIGGMVSTMVYTDIVKVPRNPNNKISSLEPHYCLQVVSDSERHCKLMGKQPSHEELIQGKYIDIHNRDDAFRMLMDLSPKH